MADDAQVDNLAAIRQLLLAAFMAEDFRRFCLERPITIDQNLQLIACAGSGKTQVVSARLHPSAPTVTCWRRAGLIPAACQTPAGNRLIAEAALDAFTPPPISQPPKTNPPLLVSSFRAFRPFRASRVPNFPLAPYTKK